MKNNKVTKIIWYVILISFVFLLFALSPDNAYGQSTNVCAQNINKQWAWTKSGAWMSTNKTGDWKTDNWFYMLKENESVVVLKTDARLGYYLVCYDFGSDTGWQPLVGWVQKQNILLQSSITPMP